MGWLKLNFSYGLIQLCLTSTLTCKLQFQQNNSSLIIQVAFPSPLQLWNNVSNRKSNLISLICQLHERSENGSMPWHRFEKEIEKEPEQPLPLSESQDDILGRGFEVDATSSCARLQLHRLCLGLVSRMLRPVLITHAGLEEGVGSWLWERSVRSNTDIAFCRVSERSGQHHGSALGWGRCASLPSTHPSAELHGWLWWLDING